MTERIGIAFGVPQAFVMSPSGLLVFRSDVIAVTELASLIGPFAIEGYGSGVTGGAGGTRIFVTNLNSTGPGSLYAALTGGSNRLIDFSQLPAGGTISAFRWNAGDGDPIVNNITIDGTTAPSPGIMLDNTGAGGDCLGMTGCSNMIVRSLRVRNAGNDNIHIFNVDGFVIDHCSMKGAHDGNIDITAGAHEGTVQWCIIGNGASDWAGCSLCSASSAPVGVDTRHVTYHHNLFLSQTPSGQGSRMPLLHNTHDGGLTEPLSAFVTADIVNNIMWGWGANEGAAFGVATEVDQGARANVRKNFYQTSGTYQDPGTTHEERGIVVNQNGTTGQAYTADNFSGNGVNLNDNGNQGSLLTDASGAPPAITEQGACAAAALILANAGCRVGGLDSTDQAFITSVSLANCTGP